jgi:hypothetical protein
MDHGSNIGRWHHRSIIVHAFEWGDEISHFAHSSHGLWKKDVWNSYQLLKGCTEMFARISLGENSYFSLFLLVRERGNVTRDFSNVVQSDCSCCMLSVRGNASVMTRTIKHFKMSSDSDAKIVCLYCNSVVTFHGNSLTNLSILLAARQSYFQLL